MSGKSIWAIAAGVIFMVVVSTLVDIVFHATRVYPPWDLRLAGAMSGGAS